MGLFKNSLTINKLSDKAMKFGKIDFKSQSSSDGLTESEDSDPFNSD